ncbi:hypothetical protein BJY24_000929 [Nocardia transvalensis]|uniref:Peptide zinc metalloprotease protein n=1 Tax=Nocardia transvalensis TaxID=37333 RepID=A0A7W9UGE3_9NOCA|nr:hypothetical protein [Nocardia transvalensis]
MPRLEPASRIRLHDLAKRPDNGEWLVGRFDTRRFVALPDAGVTALDLLGQGLTVEQTTQRMNRAFDIRSFAEDLVALGFVAEVDGRPVPGERPLPATFARVRPEHLRFALSPALPVLFCGLMLAAIAVLVARPELLPGARDLLWSPHGSLVLVLSAVAGWSLVFAHELGHFVIARATGVHARIRLGTRLQFLVAETDISGIELAPRRHRLTAYLAGMAVNLSTAAVTVLLLAVTDAASTAHRMLAAGLLIALLPLPFQFMVFMRTDLYFVLQDLMACRDLFGDGRAYARYTWHRLRRAVTARGRTSDDPSRDLPAHERRAVRVYSVVLVAGTAVCLTALATLTLPADLALIARAVGELGPGHPMTARLDGAVVVAVLGGVHMLWAVTWWRRRRAGS